MTKRRKGEAKAGGRGRRTKRPVARPRTFKEVVAYNLQDPFHAPCLARRASGERFDDPARGVSIYPDREGGTHWPDGSKCCGATKNEPAHPKACANRTRTKRIMGNASLRASSSSHLHRPQ
jgi:hypothetical protein